jgi:hypothetical protein
MDIIRAWIAAAAALLACAVANAQSAVPEQDWVHLFDGRTLNGWTPKITKHPVGENYANTFRVEDGLLKVSYDGYKSFDGQFGHLFYRTPFSYYRLVVEYRFVEPQAAQGPAWARRNSGVMFHSQDPRTMQVEQDFPVSVEAQFLGGLGDGKARSTLNVCTPGTDIVYRTAIYPEHCLSSSSKTFEGDQWVRAELVVLGYGPITHIVNGETVLEYTLPQTGGRDVKSADVAGQPHGKLIEGGYLALQGESHPIEFRKVALLNLAGCRDPRAANYRSYYVKSEPEQCQYAWRSLFNGKDLEGWRQTGPGRFVVENGMLRTEGGMGLLWYTREKFKDATLRIVYRAPDPQKAGNSGVFIRIPDEPEDPWGAVHKGYEVQIDESDDDYHRTGVLYSFTKALARPEVREWNTMEITLEGERTVITVNRVTVTDFREGDPVPEKKKRSEPERGRRPVEGYIGLQNHGDKDVVLFKEISVRQNK